MSSAKKIEEYFENEEHPAPSKSPRQEYSSTPSRTEEIKQAQDLSALNSPSWSFAAKPQSHQIIPESIDLDADPEHLAEVYKSLDLFPYPFSNEQRTKTHTILIKKQVLVQILEKYPDSELMIKRALLESLGEVKYTALERPDKELTAQENQKVSQLLLNLNHWVWRFQQLNSLIEPDVKFRTVEQILVYYFFHLYGLADVYYIRKSVGKGTSTIIALVQFTGHQEPPFFLQSQVTELEKQRITQEIAEKIEVKKGETNIPLSYEQIEEFTNLIHFRDYKSHVLKLMRLKNRSSNLSEKNNSQTASEAPLFKQLQESRPQSPVAEEEKKENLSRSLFNAEGFKTPEIILADTDSFDDQKSLTSGVLGGIKIHEKMLGKRISSLRKVEEIRHVENPPTVERASQSQDKQERSPSKEVGKKEDVILNKRSLKVQTSDSQISNKDDGQKQIESIERERGEFIESYLKMTGAFHEAIQFVHEFQDSLKRQLEIGKYVAGDRLNIELKVKVARNP